MNEQTDNKIVVVTRSTRLEELVARFGTKGQAKFYIEHSGLDFCDYEIEHDTYHLSLKRLKASLTSLPLKTQYVDREFLPNFMFGSDDIVVVIGQDGLVVNTAKYLSGQPIVAVNPDPRRYDGVMLPFRPEETACVIGKLLKQNMPVRSITMAEAQLNDGQSLFAFNDLYIGAKSHVSARYHLNYEGRTEAQSSSGIIISTGAGSTGWLSSAMNMARGLLNTFSPPAQTDAGNRSLPDVRLSWEEKALVFVVREPFVSVSSSADIAAGFIRRDQEVVIESRMPECGVIFSDGIETDCLEFNAGTVARIRVADSCAKLVMR
jgi:NAD kinase